MKTMQCPRCRGSGELYAGGSVGYATCNGCAGRGYIPQVCAYVGGKDAVGDDAPTCRSLATKGRWCDVHAPKGAAPAAEPRAASPDHDPDPKPAPRRGDKETP